MKTDMKSCSTKILFLLLLFLCSSKVVSEEEKSSASYDDLVSLFNEFRELQQPKIVNSVPDYTVAAMKQQYEGLKRFQSRLGAIDTSGWPISEQVDYHLVRAEMNGLDFQHRVLRPWSRDPGFYKTRPFTTPFKYKSTMYESLHIPKLPLPDDGIVKFRTQLKTIPVMLKQAKENLTEVAGDLAILAMYGKEQESAILRDVATRLAKHHPDLVADAERARVAVDDFRSWLEENKNTMSGPAGIGKENYNWWLKNVHLFPYTWDECMAIVQHEYNRAISTLKLEENRNRKLPLLEPVKTEAAFNRQWKEAEDCLLKFIRDEEIFTAPDYLTPIGPQPFETWASNPGRQGSLLDFFEQLGDRDPMTEIIHNTTGHNFDGLRLQRDDRPIRGKRRRFGTNIRSEAVAYGLEEMLMHAGLFDNRRRSREVVYIAIGFRAARALVDLKINSNELTVTDALQQVVDSTPYGWAIMDGELWLEMETILRSPGHHMGFIVGKSQLEKLLADRAMQLGDKFNLHQFMDEFLAAGVIPMSLIRWEMTGYDDEIKKLW